MYCILKEEKTYPEERLFISWFVVSFPNGTIHTTLATKLLNVKSILGVI